MKVLVCAASKHGATTEIAAEIGAALAALGVEATVLAPSEVSSIEGFDAAVIGSAIYAGRWLEPARDLVERHQEALRAIPVWLFSSGPVGTPPKPDDPPADAEPLAALIGAREVRLFAGEIDKSRLGFAEKAIVAAIRAQEGDFRPWGDIERWAREIARTLQSGG